MVNCEPAWWIGLRSSGSHGESPNGTRKSDRLDVEAGEVTEKVQTERKRTHHNEKGDVTTSDISLNYAPQ